MENQVAKTNGGKSVMEAIQSQIAGAVKDGANLLLPQQILSDIPAMHNVTIEHVTISSKMEDGDIYPKQGDATKFILTKQGIMKLCACAGVEWNWQYCTRTDNGKDRNYISYRAVGAVRKLDGSWMSLQGEYDMDFEVLEDDLRNQYIHKSKTWNKSQTEKDAYVESMTNTELIRLRRYKMGRCETGAMLRALRGLLTLKNSYTKAELDKPFVIARLAFQPDYNDPEIRKQFISAATQAIHGVFGSQQGQGFPSSSNSPFSEDKIYDVSTDEPLSTNDPETEMIPEDMGDNEETDFMNCEDAEQIRVLRALSKQTGVPVKDERLSSNPKFVSQRLDLFKFLKSKIKPEEPITIPEDEIPF